MQTVDGTVVEDELREGRQGRMQVCWNFSVGYSGFSHSELREKHLNLLSDQLKMSEKLWLSVALGTILSGVVTAQFIYLNSGVFKFITGIGMPIDVGMSGGSLSWFSNVQVFYKLPDNISYFEPYKVVHKRAVKNTFNRASLYEGLLEYSERFGFSGRECIHRLICEVAHRRVNRRANGLLGEVIHILFSPGHDPDGRLEEHRAAQWQGLHNSSACEVVYKDCFHRGNPIEL